MVMKNAYGTTGIGKAYGRALIAVVVFALAGALCCGCAAQPQASSASESANTSQSASASESASQSTSAGTSTGELQLPADAISWEEASSHVGETVTVYGQVVEIDKDSDTKGQPTYFDLGVAFPDPSRTTMVIDEEDMDAFSDSPETAYAGKTICVTGEIYQHEGVNYVKATSPSQVQVLD
jgi:hypothetical protein